MTLCTSCLDRHDRERPATYLSHGRQLCDDCLSDVGEVQQQQRLDGAALAAVATAGSIDRARQDRG